MTKQFWEGRKVFVTGATGLLGGWLTAELLARGADVVALVRDRQRFARRFLGGWLVAVLETVALRWFSLPRGRAR